MPMPYTIQSVGKRLRVDRIISDISEVNSPLSLKKKKKKKSESVLNFCGFCLSLPQMVYINLSSDSLWC